MQHHENQPRNTFSHNKCRKMLMRPEITENSLGTSWGHPNLREFVILFALLVHVSCTNTRLTKRGVLELRVCVCLLIAKWKHSIILTPVKLSLHLHLCNQVNSSLSYMRTWILTLTNTWSHDPVVLICCLFQTGRKATTKTKRYTRLHHLLRRLASFSLSTND